MTIETTQQGQRLYPPTEATMLALRLPDVSINANPSRVRHSSR